MTPSNKRIGARQTVDLVTEIRRIVRSYPGGLGIIKELIQNADDAGAKHVHITLDLRTHQDIQLPESGMSKFLGPALLIFNDSTFSDKDFEAIQSIGRGSKTTDLTKAGRFGLGFNSVYHVTDYPSIASRDRILIFDPLGAVFEDQGEGWKFEDHEITTFLEVYKISLLSGYQLTDSTVLRLPLRIEQNNNQTIISRTLFDQDRINKLKEDLLSLSDEILIFLKSVTTVSVSEIKEGCNPEMLLSIKTINKSVVLKNRQELLKLAKRYEHKNWKRANLQDSSPISYKHEIEIKSKLDLHQSVWQVCQIIYLDASGELEDSIQEMNKYEEKAIPWGGVAAKIETSKFKGKAYCFLPLNFSTGLPVHVHGFFDLDEARNNLTSQVDHSDPKLLVRATWNLLIVKYVLTKAYSQLLKDLAHDVGRSNPKQFYRYFPTTSQNSVLRELPSYVLKEIYTQPIIRSVVEQQDAKHHKAWISPQIVKILPSEARDLLKVLSREKIHFPDPVIPAKLVQAFKAAQVSLVEFTPTNLRQYLNLTRSLRCQLNEAPSHCLKRSEWINLLLKYCISDRHRDLTGLPLAILEEGTLETFGHAKSGNVFWVHDDVRSLVVDRIFADYPYWFLNAELTKELSLIITDLKGLAEMHSGNIALNLKIPLKISKENSGSSIHWTPENQETPNQSWLEAVYEYFTSVSESVLPIEKLKELPLVPCNDGKLHPGGLAQTPLWPAKSISKKQLKTFKYFNVPLIEAKGTLKTAIQKFLDKHPETLIWELTAPDLVDTLSSLQSLPAYSAEDYQELVSYLASDRLWQLEKGKRDLERKNKLRALAIYPTIENQPTNLTSDKVYVPGGYTPPTIAGSLKILALGRTPNSQEWHDFYIDFLEVKVLNHFEMIEHLLESYSSLNKTEQLEALAWIRDHLDLAQNENPRSSNSIKDKLKTNPLVQCEDGKLRSLLSLYHPDQKKTIQQVLGNQAHFPDMSIYKQGDWLNFFQKLGIQKSPSAKDILGYIDIKIIEAKNGVSKEISDSLKEIFQYIQEHWDTLCIEKISQQTLPEELKIRKWLPVQQNKGWLEKNIPGASASANRLYQCREILFTRDWGLKAGSQRPLFYVKELPKKEVWQALGFYEPTKEEVISHFKIIIELWESNSLKVDDKRFQASVNSIYRFLYARFLAQRTSQNEKEWLKEELKDHKTLWSYGEFWKPEHCFQRECPCFGSRRQKISPESPIREVFELLGQKPSPEIEDYIAFVDEVAEESGGNTLEGKDLNCVIATLHKLSQELEDEKKLAVDYDLLLLSDDNLLLPPEGLYIPDAPWYLDAIKDRSQIKILHNDIPHKLAISAECPSLLENVREEATQITPDNTPNRIQWCKTHQSHLHSTCFLGALARLIAHQRGEDPEWDETWLKDWLTQVTVEIATEITTALYLGKDTKNPIASGIKGTHYYQNSQKTFYIANEEELMFNYLARGLNQELKGLAQAKVNEEFSFQDISPLMTILSISASKIEGSLDRLKIKKLNRVTSQFFDMSETDNELEIDEIFDNDLDTEDELEVPDFDSQTGRNTNQKESKSSSLQEQLNIEPPTTSDSQISSGKAKPILAKDRQREPIIKRTQPRSEDFSQTLDRRPIRPDTDSPNSSTSIQSTSSNSSSSHQSGSKSGSETTQTKTTYTQQYRCGVRVRPDSEEVGITDQEDWEENISKVENQSIDQAGTQAVLRFEISAGREPKDMNDEQPNHPGYDIESRDPNTGEIRYIEVKSLKGDWGKRGVCVTRTQFVMGDDRRARFWLYVVEWATSENPQIHRIQNPVGLVGEFYYDNSWQQLEEKDNF